MSATELLLDVSINEHMFVFCSRLAKIKQHVDAHFSEPFTLADAAKLVSLEKTYFCRLFHEKVGISFGDWLARERINRALLMLMNHDHSITDLGFAVGFRDLRTFERAFKKCTGITPHECKKMVLRYWDENPRGRAPRWEEIAPTLHDAAL